MVMLHDKAEAGAIAWVREVRRLVPGITPAQAMAKIGADGRNATWDSVTCEWAVRWLAANRPKRIA